jgi:hypothetical protein
MAEKRFSFDDLDDHMKNRNIHKSKVERLRNEIKVDTGKLEQLKKELYEAEANLNKEERLLTDILSDLTKQ